MQNKMGNYILLLSALVLLNACKQQPKPLVDASSETAPSVFTHASEQADRLLTAFMGSEGSPVGLSIAISIEGKILYARGFGFSDVETKDQVTPAAARILSCGMPYHSTKILKNYHTL